MAAKQNYDLDNFDLSSLKQMDYEQLDQLSIDIRQKIIETVAKNGGHLASNLGVVELTIALHRVFNSPHDKIIFDVSHQAYSHKLLTGRKINFSSLRKFKGLSGFAKQTESIHDVFEAGHSSTAIAAGLGFLVAKEEKPSEIGEVIALVGDASITNGLSFEALNFLGSHPQYKMIIIINDNEMSISQNIGALARAFNRIRVKRHLKKGPKFLLKWQNRFKLSVKSYIYNNQFFTSLGFQYFEGIDGHNIKQLEMYLNYAKKQKKSIVLHVKTIKGKGYSYAENDEIGSWHGVGPFDIEQGLILSNQKMYGELIAEHLLMIAKQNPLVRIITPAMSLGSGLQAFKAELPKQFIDVGIAEASAVVMAASMRQAGLIPIVFMYSTFFQRAYDQIVHDIARTKTNVIFCIDRCGIVDDDGDTHQGIFDLAFLSALPHLMIAMPKDPNEANALLDYALTQARGPFILRYPKQSYLDYSVIEEVITSLNWEIIYPIQKKTIITYGSDLANLRDYLRNHHLHRDFGLINARFIKPIDIDLLNELLSQDVEVYLYEQVIRNSSLASLIRQDFPDLKLNATALPETFLETGKVEELKALYNLTYQAFINKIKG